MINHANCSHPSTKKDRAACRKAKGAGKTHTGRLSEKKPAEQVLPAWTDPNATGALDSATLDARIRDSRRKPAASPVKVSRVDPSTIA